MFLVISDADGKVVRTVFGPTAAGMHRVTWDLRDPAATLPAPVTRGQEADEDSPRRGGSGPLVAPGKYKAAVFKRYRGEVSQVTGPVEFNVVLDTPGNPNPKDIAEQVAFHRKVLKLSRAVTGATNVANELGTRLDAMRRALDVAPKADEAAKKRVREMIEKNREILRALRGDTVLAARNENVPESISERVGYAGRRLDAIAERADGHAEGAVRHRRQGVHRRTGEAASNWPTWTCRRWRRSSTPSAHPGPRAGCRTGMAGSDVFGERPA